MTYEVWLDKEPKWGTDFPDCLPDKQMLKQMYDEGYHLRHKGKKLSIRTAQTLLKEVCE